MNKTSRVTLRLTVLLMLALIAGMAGADTLRLAPLPLENREAVVRQFQPLVDYLAKEMGEPAELVWSGFHDDVLQSFINGEVDIAFLGPLPFLHLYDQFPEAIPLIRFVGSDGQEMYRCALVHFVGDPVHREQLSGKRIGLTQPLSTCGYLGTNAILKDYAGVELEQTRFDYMGSHEAVALGVIAGQVDAGGVKDEFALKYAAIGLEVLAWSQPVPGVALIANGRTLSHERITRLREVLLATPPEVYSRWGSTLRHGMRTAHPRDFDALRTFGSLTDIPAQGGR